MTTEPPSPPADRSRARVLAGAALLAAGAALAYRHSFGVPLVYDDLDAIPGNPSIRHLWPPGGVLLGAPGETTVGGRPLANFSLAFNYALGGTAVGGYHVFNLAVHVLAAATLFGLVRRTLARRSEPGLAAHALPLALGAALLWVLHPLATESVTYVVQRVESLMGLWYLLTLYAFARSLDSPRPAAWRAAAVAACFLGMATKEVMATAPILVLLYDRTFAAGSFQRAWQARRRFYLALASSWILLGALVIGTGGNRRGAAGFNVGVSVPGYWLAQLEAVARYLGLALWPRPLVFEYGSFPADRAAVLVPCVLVTAALVGGTLLALRRRPALGFLGAAFLLVLAPSSVVPVATQTMAEHRMYLPLAAVCVAAVLALHAVAGRAATAVIALLAVALGFTTAARNETYRTDLALWSDTVQKRPGNANAHNNLGLALFHSGDAKGAIHQYEAALQIAPSYPGVLSNLGNALRQDGQSDRAIDAFTAALRLEPNYAPAGFNLASALADAGRETEAIAHYEAALQLSPRDPRGHFGLGVALQRAHHPEHAAREFAAAIELDPAMAEARERLGVLLCAAGQGDEGTAQLREAVRLRPDSAPAHFDLANALVGARDLPGAESELEAALRLDPGLAPASTNLGIILFRTGHPAEGLARIEAAIRLRPDLVDAHFARAMALLQSGRRGEAEAEDERIEQLSPGDPRSQHLRDLLQSGR